MSEEKRRVYHYFHNCAFGSGETMEAEQTPGLLIFELQDCFGFRQGYMMRVDPRDQRTLVAFDGHIPSCGIPKSGDVVLSEKLTALNVPARQVRTKRSFEEDPPWFIFDNGKNEATLHIKRYFMLLSKSVACVRKYDSKSFRPIYVFIEVNEKGVTWRTSSY